jgi:large subunit ribosomal protein L4
VRMATLPIYDMKGSQTGEAEVSAEVFDAEPNGAALHQVVLGRLAAGRQGTAHTRTRGEVAGSTRKLWRQKGTGRARVGDRNPPHRTGGGVAMGPRTRSHRQHIPKRLKAAALRSALSARARAGELTLLDQIELPEAKTKALYEVLQALGAERSTLLVLAEADETVWRCGRNIPGLRIRPAIDVDSYDVMAVRKVIVVKDAVERLEARLS